MKSADKSKRTSSSKTASRTSIGKGGEAQNSASASPGSGNISQLITSGLSGSFESLRDKVSETITENGEAYLKEGVEKITSTTASLVKWSKKNPLKMAASIAALMAVSAFLIHIMHGKTGAPDGAKKMLRKAVAAR